MHHEHRWVYPCDALLTYTKKELGYTDPEIRRLEYCMECGSLRMHMGGNKWAVMESRVTKELLEKAVTESCTEVKDPPPEFTFKKVVSLSEKRLGRGIKDLLKQQTTMPRIRGLFPKKEGQ